jgi:hypothetical protein
MYSMLVGLYDRASGVGTMISIVANMICMIFGRSDDVDTGMMMPLLGREKMQAFA